ncbi:hypothetical protein [Phormidium sp. CCY1219]|nr:hypothetical protein [Phormidium sp. CCY1219]
MAQKKSRAAKGSLVRRLSIVILVGALAWLWVMLSATPAIGGEGG